MTAKKAKAEVTIGEHKMTFEGSEEFVKNMVAAYVAQTTRENSKRLNKPYSDEYLSHTSISGSTQNERNLIAEKRPRGHHEMVAVLGFALTEAGTVEFSEEDIRRAYIRAGERPPKVVAQALRDAKNKFDFLEPAGGRGLYRLTNHGDRVVRFDLPRQRSTT